MQSIQSEIIWVVKAKESLLNNVMSCETEIPDISFLILIFYIKIEKYRIAYI